MKKTCIIYANCQGVNGLYNLLVAYPGFNDKYDMTYISVHEYIHNDKELDTDRLGSADLFIYQPIHGVHDNKSTDYIMKHVLKKECKCIAFPYIYNSAIFSTYRDRVNYLSVDGKRIKPEDNLQVFKEKSFLHGFGHVYQCIKDGVSLDEIIRMYRGGELDFSFAERWETCIKLLRQKEQVCDVKIADFMEENKGHHMLFLSVNHPTTIVFWHMFMQLLDILEIVTPPYNPQLLPYDVSGMIKFMGNHPFQEFVQHYNMNSGIMGHMDKYSLDYWKHKWEYVESDKHTEWEIMDYYITYKNICIL